MKRNFITHPDRPSAAEFARLVGFSVDSFAKYVKEELWEIERDHYWDKVGDKVQERMAELMAYDISSKLREINAMKSVAFEAAVNQNYRSAEKAVSAYSELEKLERLLLDKSTSIVRVDKGEELVMRMLDIIREEVRDSATLERIAARFADLGGIAAKASDAPNTFN